MYENTFQFQSYRPQIGFSREIPRQVLGDAGRRMIEHGIGHSPRPLLEAYPIDSRNRSYQSSCWAPAGAYMDDRMSNYPSPANQLVFISMSVSF